VLNNPLLYTDLSGYMAGCDVDYLSSCSSYLTNVSSG